MLNVTPDTNVPVSALAFRRGKPLEFLGPVLDTQRTNRILECVVSAGADYIDTGDKDLLWLRSLGQDSDPEGFGFPRH